MSIQLMLLCAVTLGVGEDAETKPAGSIVVVDDDLGEDLLKSDPPAAQRDSSKLPATPRAARTRAPAPVKSPSGEGGEGGGEGGESGGEGGSGDAGTGG